MGGTDGKMRLVVLALGAGNHASGWRMTGARAGSQNLDLLKHLVTLAERGKFDLFFLADAVNSSAAMHPSMAVRFEPITLLSVLSTITTHIGLAATVNTSYSEPYNLARMMASLDHLSGGRAAWNVVAGAFPEASRNFGRDDHPSYEERYGRAAEYLQVAKALWDSWEADALTMDRGTGLYVDGAKMHAPNHEGAYFSVAGPLNITRPPQGYPVIMQAGGSEWGRDLAARTAEVVYSVAPTDAIGKEFRDDLRARAARIGRNPDHMKIMAGLSPIIGDTQEAAQRKLAELADLDPAPEKALRSLSDKLGHDLSGYDLDGPLPDIPPGGPMQGHAIATMRLARERDLTIRQLRDMNSASSHKLVVGTPEQVADEMESTFRAGVCDGFALSPAWFPEPFERFVDEVVPLLQKRGLFREEYEGGSLRENLGLPFPEHPAHAQAAQVACI